jgi:Domain of unknown function (DUF5666)
MKVIGIERPGSCLASKLTPNASQLAFCFFRLTNQREISRAAGSSPSIDPIKRNFMSPHFCFASHRLGSRSLRFFPVLAVSLASFFAGGCGGSSGTGGTGTGFSGNTSVVVLASSTANDQLFQFSVTLKSLTLNSQAGQVSLLANPVSEEFMHLNGRVEPIATVSVPQGIYTSAAAIVSEANPTCAGQSSGTLLINGSLGGLKGRTPATIEQGQPITVTGSAEALVLNLQVSQSAPFNGGCSQSLTNSMFFTPTFSLTPITIAAQPTNSANGKMSGVEGVVSSVSADGSAFTVGALSSADEGNTVPAWQVRVNGNTEFQGVANAAGLAAGMPVDMDLVIEPDGSLLTTRVAAYDTDATNLSVSFGPPANTNLNIGESDINALEVEQQGVALSELIDLYDSGNAAFQISGQLNNLQNLPFAATFNAADMVYGQNILFSTHAQRDAQGFPPLPTPATTMTLLPQTIDGTISAISSAGNFTTYAVTLAPYDLFPNLAAQPGQTTLLTDPNTVEVYADSNTQTLNTASPAVGGVFRFYGLVFNDNGTLRMDCAQMNDGVAE